MRSDKVKDERRRSFVRVTHVLPIYIRVLLGGKGKERTHNLLPLTVMGQGDRVLLLIAAERSTSINLGNFNNVASRMPFLSWQMG